MKSIPRFSTGRMNIVEMTIPHKVIYRLNAIPIKLPISFFTELKQEISQFIWKHKKSQIAKAIMRKKNGARGIKLIDSRLYYKVIVIKTIGHFIPRFYSWHKREIMINGTRKRCQR